MWTAAVAGRTAHEESGHVEVSRGSAADGPQPESVDVQSFEARLREHDPVMRRVAFRLLGDRDAMDDVLQEAYIKAFRGLDSYDGRASFATWLYRIVTNACLDELRRMRRRPVPAEPAGEIAATRPGPERAVTVAHQVRAALATLPTDQRATVVLVDGEGFDNNTAAELLGVAPGTIGSRLSRARATLRAVIEEADRG